MRLENWLIIVYWPELKMQEKPYVCTIVCNQICQSSNIWTKHAVRGREKKMREERKKKKRIV